MNSIVLHLNLGSLMHMAVICYVDEVWNHLLNEFISLFLE